MRYKISQHIEFNIAEARINNRLNEHELIITDKNSGTSFYINKTVEAFIQKFETPKSFKELTEEVSKELNIAEYKIKKIITPFFKYCRYRHFILPEKSPVKINTQKPLFEKDNILDEYKIEKIIDSTSDIDVYKAFDLKLEKPVIIKLLKKNTKDNIAALKREYDFLLQLNNTNVTPQAVAFKQQKSFAFFAQEFIDGLSLPQFISSNKSHTQKLITATAGKIIEAFAKIHSEGIVHGDIHPSNIIVTPSSAIKALDFGLALNYELEKDEGLNFGGAYFFMPPERIKKTTHKKFTTPPNFLSDVFQLGVVLFKLFYDAYPFNGVTWEELATEIKEKEISFPSNACYGFMVPEAMKEIIKKCVAKKPQQRFADATAIQSAFISKKLSDALTIRPAIEI